MASNGYERKICDTCFFFTNGYESNCTLNEDGMYPNYLSPIFQRDLENETLREKYNEPCEHYISKLDVKNMMRNHFGFPALKYD